MSKRDNLIKRGLIRFFYGPQPKAVPTAPAPAELPPSRSRVHDADPYAQLAPERLDAEWDSRILKRQLSRVERTTVIDTMPLRPVRTDLKPVAARHLKRHGYERGLPSWATQALETMDAIVAKAISEARRATARDTGVPGARLEWETTGYLERHRDAMANTGEVTRRLLTGDPAGARELILAGARRAGEGVAVAVDSEPVGLQDLLE